jgi:hypothetical protein
MWVTDGNAVLELPDDADVPAGWRATGVPDDYPTNVHAYALKRGRLQPVEGAQRRGATRARLSDDDVQRVKEAIADGRV